MNDPWIIIFYNPGTGPLDVLTDMFTVNLEQFGTMEDARRRAKSFGLGKRLRAWLFNCETGEATKV